MGRHKKAPIRTGNAPFPPSPHGVELRGVSADGAPNAADPLPPEDRKPVSQWYRLHELSQGDREALVDSFNRTPDWWRPGGLVAMAERAEVVPAALWCVLVEAERKGLLHPDAARIVVPAASETALATSEGADEACRLWMGGATVRELSERWHAKPEKIRELVGPLLGHHRDVLGLIQGEPDEDAKRVAGELWRTGARSLQEIGDLLGVPASHVLRWAEESGAFADGAARRAALIRDRLDSAVISMLRQVEDVVIPGTKDAQKAALLLGVLVDKRQLIYEKPTAIGRVEAGGDPADRVLGSIERLSSLLGMMGEPPIVATALPPANKARALEAAAEDADVVAVPPGAMATTNRIPPEDF